VKLCGPTKADEYDDRTRSASAVNVPERMEAAIEVVLVDAACRQFED